MAADIQAEMFLAAAAVGGLSIRLGFYRGFEEFRVSGWVRAPDELLRLMGKVHCIAGRTQIARVLGKAVETARAERLNAVVFVGDCMEEPPESLTAPAAGGATALEDSGRTKGGAVAALIEHMRR